MSELFEYFRSLNDNRTIGMVKAFDYKGTIFISWVKYNEDKETKPFNDKLMRIIVEQRFGLWMNGCESNKKIPVEVSAQVKHFIERCKLYYKDAKEIKVFGGGFARATSSRVNKLHAKKFWNDNYISQKALED